jgi:microcystin-dependent protein
MIIGQIFDYAGNTWDDTTYKECNGQTLSSATYSELFSKIGSNWGGNATNFALPDLRGRVCIGYYSSKPATPVDATGTTTQNYGRIGNIGGSTSISLKLVETPKHVHLAAYSRGCDHTDGGDRYRMCCGFVAQSTCSDPSRTNNGFQHSGGVDNYDIVCAGNAHENRQKYIVIRKLIKVK